MPGSKKFVNRDISWLSFNYRVLMEAADPSLPLYERLKFLAIYSSNLDEFFRVRVGTIRSLLSVPKEAEKTAQLLKEINQVVATQQQEFGEIYRHQILPQLEKEGIRIIKGNQYSKIQLKFARSFFLEDVMYQLQPILLVKNKIVPFLQNSAVYLVVSLFSKTGKTKKNIVRRPKYAMLKIPSDVLPRFIELPSSKAEYPITFLDDLIRENLDQVFIGYEIGEAYAVKISRDADLHMEHEDEKNLLEKIKKSLKKRKTGETARFLYDEAMPAPMLEFLKSSFNLKKHETVPGGRYHNFFDFFKFPNPLAPKLENHPPAPLKISELESYTTMFEAVKDRDWLMHYPYQSYDYFLRFLNEAAFDPKVFEIKATQYRVASDSAIVNALINAARNGKAVTVFVEIKARFDEESNLRFAQQMENAGVKIIYSLPGLKVHAKACLVSRKSGNRYGVRQYAFLSTGNFNEKTAKVYSDHGFFTSKPGFTNELTHFFNHLDVANKKIKFNKLLVGQFNMNAALSKLIDKEIQQAKAGKPAKILIKLNNLEDPVMIEKLYKASQAGVKIDLIIRSICCLIPGKSFSKNIRVRRIVDAYLEHARVLVFHNGGSPRVFLSSADWMKRNLYHRIELCFPIEEPKLKKELLKILDFQMKDNVKARLLDDKLQHQPVNQNSQKIRAQEEIYRFLQLKA